MKNKLFILILCLCAFIFAFFFVNKFYNIKQIYQNYTISSKAISLDKKTIDLYLSARLAVDRVSTDTNTKKKSKVYGDLKIESNRYIKIVQAWTYDFEISQNVQASPIVCGNSLVFSLPSGDLFSLNQFTGKRNWHKKYSEYVPFGRRGIACNPINKNYLLVPTARGTLCIDVENGEINKNVCGGGVLGNSFSLIEPQINKDIVYIASVNPSSIEAYEFMTGRVLWRLQLDTSGGSNPWSGLVYDSNSKILALSTGSPSRWEEIESDNSKYKYSGSIISINPENGLIKWQFQEKSKDFWDHDFVGKPLVYFDDKRSKYIVVGLNKSGQIYFLDADTGISIEKVEEREYRFGDLKYQIKKNKEQYELLNIEYEKFSKVTLGNGNSGILGNAPPLLKKYRIIDGYSGGPQWPGALIDHNNKSIILASNRGLLFENFIDFELKSKKTYKNQISVESCFFCHSSENKVVTQNGMTVPTLLLASKLYSTKERLLYFLNNDKHHKNIVANKIDINLLFKELSDFDNDALVNNNIKLYSEHKFEYNKGASELFFSPPYGLITSFSLSDLAIKWQVPSGMFYNERLNKSESGSPSYAGIRKIFDKDLLIFTGSFDKKTYFINSSNGKYIHEEVMKASGSAPPLIIKDNEDYWVYVLAGGSRIPNNHSSYLYAYKIRYIK